MKVLVVVDMQNDFVTGPLGTPEAQAIVSRVKEKIENARKNGDTIIFTQDTHYSDYLNTLEGKHLPIPHCIVDRAGWQIIPELEAFEYIVLKTTFGSEELASYIIERLIETKRFNMENIELCGVCTDICVVTNALLLKTAFPNTEIYVDSAACAGTTPEAHQAALKVMQSCHINIL